MKILRRKSAEETSLQAPSFAVVAAVGNMAALGQEFLSRQVLRLSVFTDRVLTRKAFNPIWVRELRARWRRPLTHIIVLAYTGFLAWIAWQLYGIFAAKALVDVSGAVTAGGDTAAPGRELFIGSTGFQMMIWAFIAPLLGSPAISIEHERGRLPELLMSGLTPRQIVRGKLQSVLSFVGVLLLVPLPITALCFQTGGVSPFEFLIALALQTALATALATVGLACSASNQKVVTSLGICLVVSIAGVVAIAVTTPLLAVSFIKVAIALIAGSICVARLGEEAAVGALTPNNYDQFSYSPAPLLLPDPGGITRQRQGQRQGPIEVTLRPRPVQAASVAATAPRSTPAPPMPHTALELERERAQQSPIPKVQPATVQSATRPTRMSPATSAPVERKLSWAQRVAATNPICQRELRTRLRSQESHVDFESLNDDLTIKTTGSIIMVILLFIFGIIMPMSVGIGFALIVLSLFCIVVAATTFTHEREQNMLSMLLMTFLSPREIVLGKVGVPLLLAGHYFTTPLLILIFWAFCRGPLSGISVVLLFAAFAWCASGLGVGLSWLCRHAPIAAGGAVVALGVLVGGPLAFAGVNSESNLWGLRDLWIEPVWEILLAAQESPELLAASAKLSLLLTIVGSLSLLGVRLGLRPGALDKEKESFLNTDLSQSLG